MKSRERCPIMFGLLVTIVLLATACGGWSTPGSPEPATILSASPRAGPTEEAAGAEPLYPRPVVEPSQADDGLLPQRAPNTDIRFERISVEQGLSQSVVNCILQDSKGFMWFGTGDGLNQHDGYGFTVYKHDPEDSNSLSNNVILSVYEDQSGVLWIGTYGGGLDRFDRENGQFTHYQNDPDDPHSLSDDAVWSIHEDQSGVLWIGTEGGLNRFDREQERFIHYRADLNDPYSLSNNRVSSIHEDQSGVLWIGTYGGGLDRFDRSADHFVHYQNDPNDPHSLSHSVVLSIYEDQLGVLWVGTEGGGLNRFEREKEQFTHYENDPDDLYSLSSNNVRSIHQDQSGVLWIGTYGGGLNRFDRENGRFIRYQNDPNDPHSVSGNIIWSVCEDQSGVLWIGTNGGGLSKLDREKPFIHYQTNPGDPDSLSTNGVWSVYEDQSGVLWIGTDGGGLDRFDRENGHWRHYRSDPDDPHSLSSDVVYSIHGDQSGVLWLGTGGGGLSRFDRESEQFTRYQNDPLDPHSLSNNIVLSVCEDRSSVLWIGTYGGGLNRFDREKEQFTHYQNDPHDPQSLSDNVVWSTYEDRSGVLWIGTGGGLNKFDQEKEQFIHYQNDPDDPQSLSDDNVLSIYEDQSGMLWVGTWGGGLDRFDRAKETFTRYRERDGLPNDVVYGILEDNQANLWLSTNSGLSKFNPRTETFRNYDVRDGLQSNEFNSNAYHKSSSGEMFFGGINGFNAFYPDRVRDNPYVPPIVLTSLTQGGEDVDVGQAVESAIEATFKWPDNFFEFECAALSYTQPGKNQYAYMLEGFDEGWNYIGTRRFGRYTNLPGGTYTLRLKGSNNDGVWNEEGISVTITIVPPFWETWWFRGIVALALVGAVTGGYRLRVRSIETRSRQLETQVAERTKELAALNAVAQTASRSLELDAMLTATLDKALELLEFESGATYLKDFETGELRMACHRGLSEPFRRVVAKGIISARAAESANPIIVDDLSEEPDAPKEVVEEGYRSLASIPLVSKGQVRGVLTVASRQLHRFRQQDVDLLLSIGHHIGVAVENANLYEGAKSRLAQLTALQETTRAVASTLELDILLSLITQQATTLLQAGGGILNLVDWENNEDEAVACTGLAASGVGVRSSLEDALSGWVTLHNQPVISNQLQNDSRVDRRGLAQLEGETKRQIQNAAVAPLTIKDQVMGTLVIMNKQGGQEKFDQADLDLLVAFANQAATAIENARLFEAEQRRAEQFRVISEVGRRITSILDIDEVLVQVTRLIREAFEYDHVAIALTEGDEVVYKVGAGDLWDDPQFQFRPARLKVGDEGITGWVAATGEPLLVPDVSQEPRYVWMQGSKTRSELTVPIKAKGKVIGVLDAQSERPNAFDESDLAVLQSLANQAAIAIENAHLYKQAQQAAILEERQRLARELHDSVTQALYGVTLYGEAAARRLSLGQVDLAADHLRELRDTAQDALREMRLLIFELRPSVLETEGLVGALQARLEAVEGRAGLKTEFVVDGEGQLSPEIEGGLYRIAQEALNNALKHAQAKSITLSLCQDERTVVLEVIDDGVGFDPSTAIEYGGLGLNGMLERAEELGVRLTLESSPGAGAIVRVEVDK